MFTFEEREWFWSVVNKEVQIESEEERVFFLQMTEVVQAELKQVVDACDAWAK